MTTIILIKPNFIPRFLLIELTLSSFSKESQQEEEQEGEEEESYTTTSTRIMILLKCFIYCCVLA